MPEIFSTFSFRVLYFFRFIENLISWFGGYIEDQNHLMSLLVMIEDTNSETKGIAKKISKNIVEFELSRGKNE